LKFGEAVANWPHLMIRIVGAVSDLQQPPCPDFSRRRYSIDQIEIYIPFVPIYDPTFDFSPQLASLSPLMGNRMIIQFGV
jgi:hypothetical protein